jgi:hypothetical protein
MAFVRLVCAEHFHTNVATYLSNPVLFVPERRQRMPPYLVLDRFQKLSFLHWFDRWPIRDDWNFYHTAKTAPSDLPKHLARAENRHPLLNPGFRL